MHPLNPLRLGFAALLKLWFFRLYMTLEVRGHPRELFLKYPRLILISSHTSHLDGTAIMAAIPLPLWKTLRIGIAKDYFFTTFWKSLFSRHCLGAFPIDRKEDKRGSIRLAVELLEKEPAIWMLMFPEGSRSRDGEMKPFKPGVSIFSLATGVPILFVYVESRGLWPVGQKFARRGEVTVHFGCVREPAEIDVIEQGYREWVRSLSSR